jgi:hypothetical protein
MLTDPQAITIGAQAYSLKRKNQDNFGSTWMDNTTVPGTEVRLTIRNAYEGKPKVVTTSAGLAQTQFERHICDLLVTVTDVNGFVKSSQSYTHIRNLKGANVTEVGNVAQALSAWITTNADAVVAWDN